MKRARGDVLAKALARQQDAKLDALLARAQAQAAALEALSQRVDDLGAAQRAAAAPAPPTGTSDATAWSRDAQPGELSFHVADTGFRQNDPLWQRSIDREWREMGFAPDGWTGRTIVDVGAGSRLRSLWFEGADIVVIEPLADQYLAQVAWSDLNEAKEVYSVPGETFVPEAEGRADLLVSINALDHGYDLAQSMANIQRYLKPSATAFVSFDMHDTVTDHMHPMVVKHDAMVELFPTVGLHLLRTAEHSRRYHGAAGPKARHYWLQRA